MGTSAQYSVQASRVASLPSLDLRGSAPAGHVRARVIDAVRPSSCRGSIRVSLECPIALRRTRRSEPGGQRVSEPRLVQVSHPGYISVRPNQHGGGSSNCASAGRTVVREPWRGGGNPCGDGCDGWATVTASRRTCGTLTANDRQGAEHAVLIAPGVGRTLPAMGARESMHLPRAVWGWSDEGHGSGTRASAEGSAW